MKGTVGIYEYHEREINLDKYPDLRPQHLIAFKATENGVLAHHEDQSPEVHIEATYRLDGQDFVRVSLEFWEQGGHDPTAWLEYSDDTSTFRMQDEWSTTNLTPDMTIQQWVNAAGRFVIDSFGGVYGSENDYQDEND